MAAHLHDSVLQTLALIQKNAHDSTTVARLARSQERDLRQWLFEAETTDATTLAGALKEMAADVESQHNVVVDVVTVGDCPLDEELRPVVHAAREAVVNVAKHAGTQRADVYAETSDAAVDVFVRDRGAGFDVDGVATDRHGVRSSIVDRMARHGGRADVRSAPDEGTEVRLHMPRTTSPRHPTGRGEPMTERSPDGAVRVVLVDDHAMFRAGVRSELAAAGAGRVEVVGEAADADAAIAVVRELQPQVVLLDVHLPGGGGVEVMRRQPSPDALYLALSVSDAAEDVIGTIRGGARGYVTKTITGPELVDAITRVAGGDAVFSPRLAGFVLDAFAGLDRRRRGRRGPRPAHRARARGDAPDRPRLRLQGGRQGALHLGEDRRDPHVVGAAQAPALQPPRADEVGLGPPPALGCAAPPRGGPTIDIRLANRWGRGHV